jgi:hypothetical protein
MTLRRTLMSACTGLLILGGASLPASAEHGRHGAIAGGAAAGLAAGAILGGAMASQPYYAGPAYRGSYDDDDCHVIRHRVWVPGYGWEIRREEVCD